eukprot:CAMPEP_0172301050 /NCGR_PEP_ID=MMETSP1058-20130122/3020_1 /TAXON_ID=83371 /ORGANISM="Detonula confervacea, Strain CCMP 353" /LENGTH=518 /DNA_ID=CAMNT_0013011043 /DNA_START=91 /DNA_END=1647 /DNA_ORIENTATION=-
MTFTALALSATRWIRPMMSPPGVVVHAFVTPLPSKNNAVLQQHCRIGTLNYRMAPSTRRWNSSLGSSTNIHGNNDDASTIDKEREARKEKKKAFKAGRAKRRKLIGLAKAVDRGQFQNTYSPGGPDGKNFVAKSGLPDVGKSFCVLGIESSCDDTGAAIMRSDGTILGESLASQHAIHEQWGGVVPGLAKAAHEENIDRVVQSALSNANMSIEDVDAIGVTVGPGLEICLRVGCNKGRELAMKYNKPFVGVHHLEAHILMARIPSDKYNNNNSEQSQDETQSSNRAMNFPFLALLVSGGHCQILKCLGVGKYSFIGGTLDDSLGEAFDKTARLLGLPVGGGGGPAVEALAKDGDPKSVTLPIPLQKRKDCDFSYAGLKTAVRLAAEKICVERGVEKPEELSHEDKANIAASFQHIAFRHVEIRLGRAMEQAQKEDGIQTLAVVGGVAANQELRKRLDALCTNRVEPWEMFVPPPRLCTDQGAMSAWATVERLIVGSSDVAEGHEVFARYPFSLSTNES